MFDLGRACGIMASDAVIQAFDIVQDDLLKLYLCFTWCAGNPGQSRLEVMMPFMPSDVMRCLSERTELNIIPHEKYTVFDSPKQIILVFAYSRTIPITH